jgi:hypothetical protein
MARKIFISFQHQDVMKARGFNLLRWNKNIDFNFVGRHFLDPINSENESYIRSKVKEQLKGTSVTVVLVGKETCNSEWIKWEIEQSLTKDRPNGILAIRLDENARLPPDCPVAQALEEAGAETIDWNPHEFEDALERAALAAGRAKSIAVAIAHGMSDSSCGR